MMNKQIDDDFENTRWLHVGSVVEVSIHLHIISFPSSFFLFLFKLFLYNRLVLITDCLSLNNLDTLYDLNDFNFIKKLPLFLFLVGVVVVFFSFWYINFLVKWWFMNSKNLEMFIYLFFLVFHGANVNCVV